MENWGLILYRESLIFYEENVTPLVHKEIVARVVTHEIVHMWFGNLVTPKWLFK